MQDTDTPRTDDLITSAITKDYVWPVFARQLERELNQAKYDIAELNQRLIDRREAYETYCAKITKQTDPLSELVGKVLQWGIDKGITGPNGKGTLMAQAEKLVEEAREAYDEADMIAVGVIGSKDDCKLEIGDVFVSAIIMCEMLQLTPEECLKAAYEKISRRSGKMINGTFVKSK